MINNSRVKKKQVLSYSRQIILIVFLLVIFMSSSIGYVWSNYEGTQIGFESESHCRRMKERFWS
jgi:hypothetical protein